MKTRLSLTNSRHAFTVRSCTRARRSCPPPSLYLMSPSQRVHLVRASGLSDPGGLNKGSYASRVAQGNHCRTTLSDCLKSGSYSRKRLLTSTQSISATGNTLEENFSFPTSGKWSRTEVCRSGNAISQWRLLKTSKGTLCASLTMDASDPISRSATSAQGHRPGKVAQNEVASEALRLLCHVPQLGMISYIAHKQVGLSSVVDILSQHFKNWFHWQCRGFHTDIAYIEDADA